MVDRPATSSTLCTVASGQSFLTSLVPTAVGNATKVFDVDSALTDTSISGAYIDEIELRNSKDVNLYIDAKAAFKWLKEKGIENQNIIIYGESLGTGIATEIAQNKNYAGVILESPFTSMIEAGSSKYPIFPIKLLLKDKYESNKKI